MFVDKRYVEVVSMSPAANTTQYCSITETNEDRKCGTAKLTKKGNETVYLYIYIVVV